ncbi:HAD-IIB family hydrolase [Streptomyces sp. NPDC059371]|uniref:HAD-IIB family hydrolase n=1 Tax=Streptomyces sp. NPDC059371 TaxID=3346812 RepID=UPI0036925032
MPSRTDIPPLPALATVRTVAFCDFDETYLAHENTPDQQHSRRTLEDYLARAGARHGLLFGWVTGSSLTSVLHKARGHRLRFLPHFMACSLGTELYVAGDAGMVPEPGWTQRLPAAEHIRGLAQEAVRQLHALDVPLIPQTCRAPDSRVVSYYYATRDPERDARRLALIGHIADRSLLEVNLSRCNPAAGDPEDCYDVDFLPRGCGKRKIVEHICRLHGVNTAQAFAFGDSGNDLEMLASVGRGLLVGNCTDEARSRYPRVSGSRHTDAILFELEGALK